MRTRGFKERRKEPNRKYYEKLRMDDEKMEERRRKDQERRKRKRIEENIHQDAQVAEEEKVKRLKMSKEKLLREVEKSMVVDVQDIVAPQQCAEPKEDDHEQEEEEGNCCWERMERAGDILMSNGDDILQFTSLDLLTFNSLVEECFENLMMTTFRGKERKNASSAAPIPLCIFVFMTLFWLSFYPTMICSLFYLKSTTKHAQILKMDTLALAKNLKGEIKILVR
jgi:hypothetical protein